MVFIDGKIYLHSIVGHADRGTIIFPKKSIAPAISGDFLIYVTLPNTVQYHALSAISGKQGGNNTAQGQEGSLGEINEFRHDVPIKRIWPNLLGTK